MENQIIIGKRASSNFFRKMGTLLNLEKGLYKVYDSVLGITSGYWKKTPKFNYILLFKTLYIKCEGCSPEDFLKKLGYLDESRRSRLGIDPDLKFLIRFHINAIAEISRASRNT